MGTTPLPTSAKFYIHDHLYSPVALTDFSGNVIERYEYDAYGSPTIWNADFTTERDNSNYGNPYLFTGRRVDILDSGSLKIQYNRNRYYDYYTGRWLTHDPLGITPNPQKPNKYDATSQYRDGMSLYEYVSSKPVMVGDPFGLKEEKCNICGPDVTGPIKSFASFMKSKFDDVNEAMKEKLCTCTWGFGMCGGDGWDSGLKGSFDYPNCATPPDCEQTVEVSGKCYSRHAVNYYQWGIMNKLCEHPVTTLYIGMLYPFFISGDLSGKAPWAFAGFYGIPPYFIPAPSRYRKCDVECCKTVLKGDLGFEWKGTELITIASPGDIPIIWPKTVDELYFGNPEDW